MDNVGNSLNNQQPLDAAALKRMAEAAARQASSLVEFRKQNLSAPGDVASAPFHEEWSKLLLYGTSHEAIEGFRESAKDQYVFQSYILYCLKYPTYERSYIVIICSTADMASRKLLAITRLFQSADCASMRMHMDRVVENSGKAFQAVYKDGMQVRIEAFGKGGAIRGLVWGAKRPDIIIINDPQDLEDMNSPTTMEKDWDWFLSDVIFLGNSSRLFIIGNNLGANCIIERIFSNSRSLGFDCRRYPVLDDQFPFLIGRFVTSANRLIAAVSSCVSIPHRKICNSVPRRKQPENKSVSIPHRKICNELPLLEPLYKQLCFHSS